MQGFDYKALKKGFNESAETYERQAKMVREIGGHLLQRIESLNLEPKRILDLGAGTGRLSRDLLKLYPKARIYCIDLSEKRLVFAKGKRKWFCKQHYITSDMHTLPFANESFDLVVSNLALHWSDHLHQAIYEAKRVLKIGGSLLFSTLGPDTLRELRASFASISPDPHINLFYDMHDIGDALLKSGLADPVMDIEYFTHFVKGVPELFKELKATGEINYQTLRARGMMGPKKLEKIVAHYEQYRSDKKRLPVTTEAVFGYAWRKEETPLQVVNGEIAIPISAIQKR